MTQPWWTYNSLRRFLASRPGRVWFFGKIFLLADTRREVVLGTPFLSISNADIRFAEKDLVWRSHTMQRLCLLAATWRVEFIDRREFAAAAVVQECLKDTSHCLEGLVPIQSLALIPHAPHKFRDFTIFLHLILRPSFPSSQQSAYELNLSRPPCQSTTSSPTYKTYLPFKLTRL